MSKKVDRRLFHYSVTILTRQREVLHALRGLSFAAQAKINSYITWSGTTEESWKKHHCHARFHFTDPTFRSDFLQWAADLIKPGSWTKVGESDDDPLPPSSS